MATMDKQLKIMLDAETDQHLDELAARLKCSRAQIIREAIDHRWKMQLQGIPTCANGRGCYVAHLHLIQGTHASIVTEVRPEDHARLVAPAIGAA